MKVLIKSAKVIDPASTHHLKKRDILIESGVIVQIAAEIKISKEYQVIEAEDLHVSPGWFDFRSSFGEPGYEQKETIEHALQAAMYGGFTGVLVSSNTKPAIQSRSAVEFILKKSQSSFVDVHVCGALSLDRKGEELTEMFDMKQGGASAIGDDLRSVMNSGLMQRAMQYASNVNLPLLSYPEDRGLSGKALVNESLNTTYLGFKGSPSLSELLSVNRDISLAEYLNTPLHIGPLSSTESVKAIEAAKRKNIPVTCEVSSAHLLLDDSFLSEYDTNYKLTPPLRNKKDASYLCKAILNNSIDIISSCHYPHELEAKQTEFDFASFGMINLQTSYSLVNEALPEDNLKQESIIRAMAINPRKILRLDVPTINIDAEANLTCFSPSLEWVMDQNCNKSKSMNSPFMNRTMKGKAVAIVKGNKMKSLL